MLFARQESAEAGTTKRTAKPFRLIASAAVAALALGGVVAGVAAPANAEGAVTAGAFNWAVSERVNGYLTSHVTSDGATEGANGVVTWGTGTGTYSEATGYDLDYKGTYTAGFANAGNVIYSITFKDPSVVVDNSGNGAIYATVYSTVSGSSTTAAENTKVASVTGATVSVVDGVATVSGTPNYANQLPAGVEPAPTLTNSATLPVEGGSFAPEFLGALASSVRSHFYNTWASGSTTTPNAANPLKVPAAFTATATLPVATVTEATVTEVPKAGDTAASVSIAVKGENFATTGVGIYVGLAEVGTFSATDASVYKGTKYVTAANLPGGKLDTTLTIAGADLDPAKSYAVYTLKAHGQAAADSSQTTETPVTIDYAALYPATVTEATVTEIPSTGSTAASISIAVKGENFATTNPGIYVGLAVVGTFSATDASVYKGTKFITPANLPGGKLDTTLTIAGADLDPTKSYAVYTLKAHGQAATDSSQTTETPVTIDYDALYPAAPEKVDTTSSVVVSSKTSYGKSVTAKASVSSDATGTVAFYVDGKGAGTAALVDGKASKALSKSLTVGTHKVTVKFLGNSSFAASESAEKTLTVAQATASSVKISGKSFAKNSNPSVTVTVGKLSNGSYYTGKVTLKNSAGKVVKTATIKSSGKVTVKLSKQSKSLKLKATVGSTTVKSKSSTWTTIKVKS